jgi:hypothetical protein
MLPPLATLAANPVPRTQWHGREPARGSSGGRGATPRKKGGDGAVQRQRRRLKEESGESHKKAGVQIYTVVA